MDDDELAEQELWFGSPMAPFRFQGESMIDNNYGGAPNECGWHFRHGEIIELDPETGECPRQDEHERTV